MIRTTLMTMILAAASIVSAGTITFGSDGTAVDAGEINTMGATIAISGNPGWAAPLTGTSWVSYGQTGNPSSPGYFTAPNGQIVHFYQTFSFLGGVQYGTITYRADDSAALYVNNVLANPEAPQAGNTYSTCSDFAVGCLVSTQVTLDITSLLHSGVNKLQFSVAQRAGSSFGLNYQGHVDFISTANVDEPTNTPEPASFLFIGAGLIALGCFRRK